MRTLKSILAVTLLAISSAAAAAPACPAGAATRTAALVATATAATPATAATSRQYVAFQVLSRTETSTSVIVDYVLGDRTLRLSATRTSTSSTLVVLEGTRTLLKVVTASDGTARLTNQRGVTYSTAQLHDDPSLMQQFDTYALAALDTDMARVIVTGTNEPVLNPCAIHWAVAIGCLVGSYVALCCDWGYDGQPWIECDC